MTDATAHDTAAHQKRQARRPGVAVLATGLVAVLVCGALFAGVRSVIPSATSSIKSVDYGQVANANGFAIELVSVERGPLVQPDWVENATDTEVLYVTVKLTNTTGDTRNYVGFDDALLSREGLLGSDNLGNQYHMAVPIADIVVEGQIQSAEVAPSESVTDVLLLKAPVADASTYTVRLPGSSIGALRDVAFVVPVEQIARR